MIWIIGGTSEGREMVSRLGQLKDFIVSVATDEGGEFLGVKNLHVGRMTYEEMADFAQEKSIDLIVDLSHPYALLVSENARRLAREKNIAYARYVRPSLEEKDPSIIVVKDYQEAYDYLAGLVGTVFFTTGSKNIKDFERVRGSNRFIYRILPARESLELASQAQVHMRDLVAVLGPFSQDYNRAMLREYQVDYCVSKDSGKKGGLDEKLAAAKSLGIKTILIARQEEEGYSSLDQVEALIRDHLGQSV